MSDPLQAAEMMLAVQLEGVETGYQAAPTTRLGGQGR